MKCVYPEKTGCLCAQMSNGLTGQEVANDLAVVFANSSGGGIAATLDASYYKGSGSRNGNEREYVVMDDEKTGRKYIVRRLTPTECARLQGFPDWWTDGVDGSDAAKYKMWGNGIALPCAVDVLGRIAKEMSKSETGY